MLFGFSSQDGARENTGYKKCKQYNWSHGYSYSTGTYMYVTLWTNMLLFARKGENPKPEVSWVTWEKKYKLTGKLRAKLEKSYSGVGFIMESFWRVLSRHF